MTMMMNEQGVSDTNETKQRSHHADRQQIDIGVWWLRQEFPSGWVVVGELFVEEDPAHPSDPTYRIEHWGLYSNYAGPSVTTPRTLKFEHQTGSYGSVDDFRAHLRTISGVRYIQAPCHEMAP